MKVKKGSFYLLVSAGNILLGYLSPLYLMSALECVIGNTDAGEWIKEWNRRMHGLMMFGLWFLLFWIMNGSISLLTDKKHSVTFYVGQLILSVGGGLLALLFM